MNRSIPILAIALGWASAALAATPAPLTTLRAISTLTNAQASQHLPVAFEATVIYYGRNIKNLDVQNDGIGIFVKVTKDFDLALGDRVLVEGETEPSFLPYVISGNVRVLRHGTLPDPIEAGFDDLVRKQDNCKLVRVHGIVHAADLVNSAIAPSAKLQLLVDGGYIDLEVESHDEVALKNLLDAEVEVLGAAGRKFDAKMQQTGVKLKLTSLSDIKVLKRAGASPWSLPITPLSGIVSGVHVRDSTQRLRVHGTITYYQPGSAVVLQNGAESLWVSTLASDPMQIGDVADATGFPETRDGLLALNHAEIQDTRIQEPIRAQPATYQQLSFWGRSILGGHDYDLVSIEGRVVTAVREATQDEYVLISDGRPFSAVYHHPPPPTSAPPMLQVPEGTTIRVTGICLVLDTNPYNDQAPFNILLRSFDDIAVVAKPSWLSVRNLMVLIGLLLALMVAGGARGWMIERRIRRQTVALAYVEQRRGRILEDINGARPLAEILQEITEMVSFKLKGAPCWCQIAEGAPLGNCIRNLSAMRIVHQEIPAHSGPPLGFLFVGFDPSTKPTAIETQALSMAAALAALAIETRRLYTDLTHRSEFDLLTDLHNRFSLEKQLSALIAEASFKAGSFGLIYIDLDRFKQVNDEYGHNVGDLYLQEAAIRMKQQIRPHDTLARLGGDEFGAIIALVRSRDDVQEVATRLERCFDQPFAIGAHLLHGSASVGFAVYPFDATTSDGLFSAAVAAMYKAKKNRREIEMEHLELEKS
jgi:diguanylate cyclase (GGDEF)-like protein